MAHELPSYVPWIVLAPVIASLIQNFWGKSLPRKGDLVVLAGMATSLVLSIITVFAWVDLPAGGYLAESWTWFEITDTIRFDVGIVVDGVTAAMLVVVTLVSFLVFLFSTGYMAGDAMYHRFFFWLSFFSVSMLILVVADNLLLLFIGWELVGLCSYKLIGFWCRDLANAEAAKKAFITTRIGDVGMLIGILMLYSSCGTLSIQGIFREVAAGSIAGSALTWAGIALFLGAVGKSAQFPLHVWLPDAMAGPTPVSALIHAATMVAAGVYLAARMFPIFTGQALQFIAWTGGITAILAALIAVTQTDIKKVLAYSTISQLGYMILGVGVGAPWAAMFHLCTHAMFKACLFLGSGSVIHAMHHAQELKDMGGLRKKLPITFWTFVISTAALAGLPFMSGFLSKDAILATALHSDVAGVKPLFWVGLGAAFLTAFYMTRMVWLCFFGKPRNQEKYDHAHESPWVMTVPLVILAAFSIGIVWVGFEEKFFRTPAYHAVFPQTSHVARAYIEAGGHVAHVHHEAWFMICAIGVGLGGIFLGMWLFKSGERDQDTPLLPGRLHALAKSKFHLDEFYLGGFIESWNKISDATARTDASVVDGAVNAVGH
ncbi:MAG: NADH-quinone oxidoreductase subunit L, partial [Planctomycetota bacterium]|nr:NADH-quinone oxidoreductase subunit L [Planctomycetota bacterium]